MSRDEEGRDRVPPHDQRQRMDIVAQRFVEGMSVPNIVDYLRRHEGIKVTRDVPYQDLSRVTARRWLKYEPPDEEELSKDLRKRYPLKDAYVPSFGGRMAVMGSAARLCAEAIWNIAKEKAAGQVRGHEPAGIAKWEFLVQVPELEKGLPKKVPYSREYFKRFKEEKQTELYPEPLKIQIRIGFSGGVTMAVTADELRNTLSQRVEKWEKELKDFVIELALQEGNEPPLNGIVKRRFNVEIGFVLVNLVAGFDMDARTNPISFLSGFLRDEVLEPRTELKLFNAMPFMETGRRDEFFGRLQPLSKIREEYDTKKLDVILTSGSSIDDKHGLFRRYYDSEALPKLLESHGVEGDVLWMPVSHKHPVILSDLRQQLLDEGKKDAAALLDFEPMTLLSLDEVQKHVAGNPDSGHQGADLFLVLAACSQCLAEKSRIARAALGQADKIVTHFVTDRRTAAVTLGHEKTDRSEEE